MPQNITKKAHVSSEVYCWQYQRLRKVKRARNAQKHKNRKRRAQGAHAYAIHMRNSIKDWKRPFIPALICAHSRQQTGIIPTSLFFWWAACVCLCSCSASQNLLFWGSACPNLLFWGSACPNLLFWVTDTGLENEENRKLMSHTDTLFRLKI